MPCRTALRTRTPCGRQHCTGEDVRRYESSRIEKWQVVRHLVSGYARISTPGIDTAVNSNWFRVVRAWGPLRLLGGGRFVIDLPKLPADQLQRQGWEQGRQPRGWIGVPTDSPRDPVRLFVSGHDGAHAWARKEGIADKCIRHLTPKHINSLRGRDVVIGTLPAHVAAALCERGVRYVHLKLDVPENERQKSLTAAMMDKYGASLQEIHVMKLGNFPEKGATQG